MAPPLIPLAAGAAKAGAIKSILGSLGLGGLFTLGGYGVEKVIDFFDGEEDSPLTENPQNSQQVPQPPLGQTPPQQPPAVLPPVDPQRPGSIQPPEITPPPPIEAPEIDTPELTDRSPDPQLQQYGDLINKITDPRYQFIVGEQNLDRQMRARAQAAELTERKMESMNKRLLEQENIRAWRDAFKAQTYANAQLALGTAGILMQLQRPNTQFMDSIANQVKAAQEADLKIT